MVQRKNESMGARLHVQAHWQTVPTNVEARGQGEHSQRPKSIHQSRGKQNIFLCNYFCHKLTFIGLIIAFLYIQVGITECVCVYWTSDLLTRIVQYAQLLLTRLLPIENSLSWYAGFRNIFAQREFEADKQYIFFYTD